MKAPGKAGKPGKVGTVGKVVVERREWKRGVLAGAALCAAALAAFSNSFGTGLALDNRILIAGDRRIQSASAGNVDLILQHSYWWPNGETGLYRPLTTLSYLFNYAVLGNGARAAGYHWINFLLHAGNVLLLFAVLRRLLADRARAFGTAFAVALLWAVHPVLTESVTNIVGRADLLGGMAVLGGFLMYLKSAGSTGGARAAWLAGAAVAAAAGAASKESAVVLPGILVLYELVCRKGEFAWRRVLWGCLATGAPIAAVLAQRALVLGASAPAEFPFVDNPIAGAGFWVGRLTAVKVLARYLAVVFWPVRLSSDYSYAEIRLANGSAADWAAWLVVAAALAAAVVLYRRNRLAFFFAGFAFLNLLPAANLMFPIGTMMAERLMYMASAGLLASTVIVIADARLPFPAAALVAVVALAAAGFAARTWLRNLDWQDDLTMATASVRTSPSSFKTHRLLAAALFEIDPAHRNIDRVVQEADQSVGILGTLPDDLDVPGPWNLAAACHMAKGDLAGEGEARRQYEEAARLARRSVDIEAAARAAYDRAHGAKSPVPPGASDAYRILASAYLRLRQGEQALAPAMEARTINPANAEAYTEIADAYLAQGRGEDGAVALAEGMFATGDGSLRQDLLKLYQSGVDAKGCAVVPGPRGPALNPGCEMVHRDLCAGASRARRQDLYQQLGCR